MARQADLSRDPHAVAGLLGLRDQVPKPVEPGVRDGSRASRPPALPG